VPVWIGAIAIRARLAIDHLVVHAQTRISELEREKLGKASVMKRGHRARRAV